VATGLAICADTGHPDHAAAVAGRRALRGRDEDRREFARHEFAPRAHAPAPRPGRVAEAGSAGEALVVARRGADGWHGEVYG
jgi:hypothetical protein